MRYIDAVELIDLAIENELLIEVQGQILVYGNDENTEPYFEFKDVAAKDLMNDKEGQKAILDELKKRSVEFNPKIYASFKKLMDAFEKHISKNKSSNEESEGDVL